MDSNKQVDLTFITNEKNKRLLDRFKVLIKDTRLFDVLVGYFYQLQDIINYKQIVNQISYIITMYVTWRIKINTINTNQKDHQFYQYDLNLHFVFQDYF